MSEIHFWDMDHTVLNNDCDVSWKTFLVSRGYAPVGDLDEAAAFYEEYEQGVLRVELFNAFQLRDFSGKTWDEMLAWSREHFAEIAKPQLYMEAERRIAAQRADGLTVCLLTATNRVIATPVAEYLEIDLLATELSRDEAGRFTGGVDGTYCVGQGKLEYVDAYCEERRTTREHAWYYGDSTADIAILEQIGHPVAVNPSPALRDAALANDWPVWDFL